MHALQQKVILPESKTTRTVSIIFGKFAPGPGIAAVQ